MAVGNSPYDVLMEFQQKIIDALQDSLVKKGRFAKGTLYQAIDARVKTFFLGQKVELQITMTNWGEIEPYWRYVEGGRKAGSKQPPQAAMLNHITNRGKTLEPIAQDIAKYRIETKGNKKGLKVKRKKPLPITEARKTLAFLIGRNIKKKGIKPTHFASEVMEGNLIKEMSKEINLAVGREIKLTLANVV